MCRLRPPWPQARWRALPMLCNAPTAHTLGAAALIVTSSVLPQARQWAVLRHPQVPDHRAEVLPNILRASRAPLWQAQRALLNVLRPTLPVPTNHSKPIFGYHAKRPLNKLSRPPRATNRGCFNFRFRPGIILYKPGAPECRTRAVPTPPPPWAQWATRQ